MEHKVLNQDKTACQNGSLTYFASIFASNFSVITKHRITDNNKNTQK